MKNRLYYRAARPELIGRSVGSQCAHIVAESHLITYRVRPINSQRWSIERNDMQCFSSSGGACGGGSAAAARCGQRNVVSRSLFWRYKTRTFVTPRKKCRSKGGAFGGNLWAVVVVLLSFALLFMFMFQVLSYGNNQWLSLISRLQKHLTKFFFQAAWLVILFRL